MFSFLSGKVEVQLTLEQYGFELCGSASVSIVENKYIGKFYGDLQQFEKPGRQTA